MNNSAYEREISMAKKESSPNRTNKELLASPVIIHTLYCTADNGEMHKIFSDARVTFVMYRDPESEREVCYFPVKGNLVSLKVTTVDDRKMCTMVKKSEDDSVEERVFPLDIMGFLYKRGDSQELSIAFGSKSFGFFQQSEKDKTQ